MWPPQHPPEIRINGLNTLTILRQAPGETWLDGGEAGEILLPADHSPGSLETGGKLDVFVYPGKAGQLIASTRVPYAMAGDCACLEVVSVTRAGAFLDWGLEDDLLVPVSQQLAPMQQGCRYVVYLFADPHNRIIGSSKLHRFLDEQASGLSPGDEVDLLIATETDLGFKAVINGKHLGLLFRDETFRPLQTGDRTTGYIKAIRGDGKIDLSLQPHHRSVRSVLTEQIVAYLEAHGGVSSLTDYSPPAAIFKQFGVSKGNYKKALGALYKQRRISLDKHEVRLLKAENE